MDNRLTKNLQDKAVKGDIDALYVLGEMYETEKNITLALNHFRMAASLGCERSKKKFTQLLEEHQGIAKIYPYKIVE